MSDVRDQLAERFDRAIADGSQVIAIAPTLPLVQQLAAERDRARNAADMLAEGIARLTGVQLSADDPWGTALAATYIDTWDRTRPEHDRAAP